MVSIPVDIDVIVIITVYLLAYGSETGAGMFVICLGLLTDIFSGGIWGFHAILYVIVYLLVKIVSRPFDLLSAYGQIALISIAVLAKEFISIPLLHLFSLDTDFSFFNVIIFIISALFSGLIAPVLFYLLNLLGRFFQRAKEKISSQA